jgi:hypothetical protein
VGFARSCNCLGRRVGRRSRFRCSGPWWVHVPWVRKRKITEEEEEDEDEEDQILRKRAMHSMFF